MVLGLWPQKQILPRYMRTAGFPLVSPNKARFHRLETKLLNLKIDFAFVKMAFLKVLSGLEEIKQ